MMVRIVPGGAVLVRELRQAHGVVARGRGLMFAKPLAPGEGLDIRPCSSIHMMFMRFRLDAVFYNRELKVTRVARNLPTWRGLAFGGKGARGVLELPVGAAESVSVGDQLEFVDRSEEPG